MVKVEEELYLGSLQDARIHGCASFLNGSYDESANTMVFRKTGGPVRRSRRGWTEQEDKLLTAAVTTFNGKNWKEIAKWIPRKTTNQCFHRWHKVLNPELTKGSWTEKEDKQLIELVRQNAPRRWGFIAKSLPGRIGKQCRERWYNHLDPSIKKGAWTSEEELVLARCLELYGSKWSIIARFLPGRTDNAIKNHWNCHMKKNFASWSSGCLTDKSEICPQLCSSEINSQSLKVEWEEPSPGKAEDFWGRRPLLKDGSEFCPSDLVLGGIYSRDTKTSESLRKHAVFWGDKLSFACSSDISLLGSASSDLNTSFVQPSPLLTTEKIKGSESGDQILYHCLNTLTSGPSMSSGRSSTSGVAYEVPSIIRRRTTSKKIGSLTYPGSEIADAFKTKTGALYLQKPGNLAATGSIRKCLEFSFNSSVAAISPSSDESLSKKVFLIA